MSTKRSTFCGTWTALVTPFTPDLRSIDYDSLSSLIEFQISSGVQGLVACGSTAESSTLSDREYRAVIEFVLARTAGRVPCIAGIGTNNTVKAVELAQEIEACGCAGILLTAPPYNKPPQRGIEEHFRAVHRAVGIPIIAYNVPGRTAVLIAASTLANLVREKVIVGVKDATGSIDQLLDLLSLVGTDAGALSGEDSLIHACMASGGVGTISASANIIPREISSLTAAALQGDLGKASEIQLEILPIVRAMFAETNPIPVKTALALRGIIASPALRLPLVPALPDTVALIRKVLSL